MAYATVKASYLVSKFQYMIDNKWGYIANAAGIKWTQEKQDASNEEQTRQYGQQWVGHMVADCSGAFYYWYKQAGSYMYHGSNTMWRQYATQKGRIGDIDLVPGMAVYKLKKDGKEPVQYREDGLGNFFHVGLYIGGGKVIEAKGTKAGVVISCVSDGWTHASKLKYTEYDLTEDGIGTKAPISYPVQGTVTMTSGTQNFRRAATTSSEAILRIPNFEKIMLLGEDGDWYKAEYRNKVGYVSSKYISITSTDVSDGVGRDQDKYTITLSGLSRSASESIISLLSEKGYTATMMKEAD